MKFVVMKSRTKPKRTFLEFFKKVSNKMHIFSTDHIEDTLTEAGKVTGVLALQQIGDRSLHPLERYEIPSFDQQLTLCFQDFLAGSASVRNK